MPAAIAPPGTLRRLRQEAGLTADDLVRLWPGKEMSRTTVTRIENSEIGRDNRYIRPDERETYERLVKENARHGASH